MCHFYSVLLMLYTCFICFILSSQATSPQTGGSLKSMREKSNQADKEVQEASGLKIAGPEGELTAGFMGYCLLSKMFNLTMCPASF